MRVMGEHEVRDRLSALPDWKLADNTIERTYTFDSFAAAMTFVGRVARLAEEADHHPDIDIRYNRVRLALSTHSAGGLTTRDFDLAARIDRAGDGAPS